MKFAWRIDRRTGLIAALVPLVATAVAVVVAVGLRVRLAPDPEPEIPIAELSEIRERGYLIAATTFSPHSYFIYRGQPMGYSYELLERLGEELGLEIELEVIDTIEEMFKALETGRVDLVAHPLSVTGARRRRVAFTRTLYSTPQVLVQRSPEHERHYHGEGAQRAPIRDPVELDGKTVVVRRGSAYYPRLHNLMEEFGIEIDLLEAPGELTTDELIRRVAVGSLEYTVADRNIAQVATASHRNLDIETEISLPQPIAWAVSPSAPDLLEAINLWLNREQQHADYYVIYRRYFERRAEARALAEEGFFAVGIQRLSPYDEVIKAHAPQIGWDWRLLAALIFQESRFNPRARSWAGARGLMQLMPATARAFGAQNPDDPHQSIAAGTRFIAWLQDYWEQRIPDDDERLRFVLASYNVGHGHVEDARRLAAEHGANPVVWSGQVERFMRKKMQPEYYRHSVVKHGYARGEEPVNYVRAVLSLYRHYVRLVGLAE